MPIPHSAPTVEPTVTPLQLFVEHAPAAIALFDTELRYLMASQRWLEDYGLGDRAIIGVCHYDVFPEIGDDWKAIHQRCLQGAIERCDEEAFPRSDGKTDWLKWEVRPWYTAANEIGGLIMLTEVITRQKETELALAAANEALRTANERLETELSNRNTELHEFFQLSDDMLCIAGLDDGCFKQVNAAFLSTLGYTEAELFAVPFIEFVHPDDRDTTIAIAAGLATGARVASFENRYRCKDGSYRWISWTSTPNLAARVIYATARDMTAERAKKEQLRAQRRFLNSVFDGTENLIFVLDTEDAESFYFTGWNRASEREFKIPREMALGLDPVALFGQEGERILNNHRRCAQTQKPLIYEEYFLGRDWLTTLNPLLDDHGRVYRIVGTTADITKQKLAAAQLQEYSQALEQTLQELQQTQVQMVQAEKMSSLGQLVAGVAHEINNPVNFIFGNLTHISDYADSFLEIIRLYQAAFPQPGTDIEQALDDLEIDFIAEDLPKLLNSMKVGADRIREIVASLRNFSRMDEAEQKAADIHEGIDSTLMILQNRLKARSDRPAIQIQRHYGSRQKVECFPGQLNQVFMNLLSNSIDALEEAWQAQLVQQPEIVITTACTGQYLTISIRDNGRGMSETVQQKIFNPFFTTKPVGQGTGMGLSISYQIVVEKHQGLLTCQSEVGQGTEFVVAIPV